MIHLNLYGCSFTKNIVRFNASSNYINELSNEILVKNYGKDSNSNLKILNSFTEKLKPNSTSVIQWSSLTRPNESNFGVFSASENPLWDLLDEWYGYIDETIKLASDNNIKLIQYIGWAQWKDSELNEYHRTKLRSYDFEWFESIEQYDAIRANCFQFQPNLSDWSSHEEDGLWKWASIEWGGMAEWIRSNIEMNSRYIGYEHFAPTKHFDSHPSEYATTQFLKDFLIPKVKTLNEQNFI